MHKILQLVAGLKIRFLVISISLVCLIFTGCGSVGTKPVSVALTPNTAQTIDQTETVSITATVANDTGTDGVTWLLVGAGSLTTTTTTATYTAPNSVTSPTSVSVTATSVADTNKSASLTINLVPPPTITISSSSLNVGNVGLAYSTTVPETGGVGPFTWSITAGPAWISTNGSTSSTVTMQGTPTSAGNPVPVTIKVTDADGLSFSANLNLTINNAIANACAGSATGNESVLAANHQYAFFLQGLQGPGAGSPVAIAGSIATDGTGHVTGGEEDINVSTGPQHLTILPANSFYTVGSDNRGCLMLTYSGQTNTSTVFSFAVGGINAGVASKGRIIEFDDNSGTDAGTRGSGIIRLQDKTAFSLSSLHTRYAFALDGLDSVGAHVSLAGAFTVNTSGNITNGFLDENDGGQLQSGVTGATGTVGTTSTTATTGRETATLAWTSNSQNYSMTNAVYVVNADEFFMIQIDQLAVGKPITSGRAIVTGNAFNSSSLSGNYVFHNSGSVAGAADVTLGIVTLSSGAVNGSLMQYTAAGGLQTTSISGGSYAVDASNSGRVILSGVGSNPPILYLATPTADTETISAFIIGTGNSADFGLSEVQPTATYSTSSLSGNFVIGTEYLNDNTVTNIVGIAVIGSNPVPGTFEEVEDFNVNGGDLQTNSVNSKTLFVNADGSAGFVGNTVFAVTNGTKLFCVQAEQGAAAYILVVEQ